MDAFHLVGTSRLAARISDIKDLGYDVEDKWVEVGEEPNRKRVKAYRIPIGQRELFEGAA